MKHEPRLELCSARARFHIIEYDTIRVARDDEAGVTRYEIETPATGRSPAYGGVYLLSREEAEQIIEGLKALLEHDNT